MADDFDDAGCGDGEGVEGDDDRKMEPTKFSKLVEEVMEKIGPESKTEEDWAAHDLRVRASIERSETQQRRLGMERQLKELLEAGLAERFITAVLVETDKRQATQALKMALKLPDHGPGTWVFASSPGAGKTYAAHAWLLRPWEAAKRIVPARLAFCSAHEFSRQSRFGDKFERYESADRMVLDDMGVEFLDTNGSTMSDLDALIDGRWRRGRATLMTTNLKSDAFALRYGQRIMDRLVGDGGWVDVTQTSLRRA